MPLAMMHFILIIIQQIIREAVETVLIITQIIPDILVQAIMMMKTEGGGSFGRENKVVG